MKVQFDSHDPVEQVAAVVEAVYGVTVRIDQPDPVGATQERNRHDRVRIADQQPDDGGGSVGS